MDQKPKKSEEEAEDWDFSEGFGGIPDDLDLTKNIGCTGGGSRKKQKENSAQPESGKENQD
ncbi:hypothetical protein [Belliella pelovolcani]|jgi:hypothetical protein|uniref:Uncharacterized protein n=1 Tax=Belliella pelovolcani TaxID=529505 RepID=A0A1N7KSJ9_9BACT|nr:hypothetical protein [Belliella pelovolcani]SIS64588.1 hypothetical protein SAMN05421761_102313 [Belliella pelovolcani]